MMYVSKTSELQFNEIMQYNVLHGVVKLQWACGAIQFKR